MAQKEIHECLVMQVSEDVSKHLEEADVKVKDYEDVQKDLKAVAGAGTKLWLDPAKVSSHNACNTCNTRIQFKGGFELSSVFLDVIASHS